MPHRLHQLLDSLAHITSYRDVQRLELSLLKTLHEILNPLSLQLYKVDEAYRLLIALSYQPAQSDVVELQPEQAQSQPASDLVRRALQQGQPCFVQAADASYLCAFPVVDMHDIHFCLLIGSQEPLVATEEHLISSFFRIYHNFCRLLEDAQTDELTGLLNRKTFDENFLRISQELIDPNILADADDRRRVLAAKVDHHWMAVLDIDHFKQVNDTYGHIFGDEVLILISRLMQQNFRRTDYLYRFGGEEFVIVAHCGGLAEAKKLFTRLHRAIESYPFPQVGQVTASIGVVQLTNRHLASSLLDQADQALYYAKSHGRNQLHFYQELLDQGLMKEKRPKTGSVDLF
ncbi:GGDEF domain-containing protein [Marinospirillum sp. MEB164]|uniref:diguanylate cyclase n=1 Tax=Marinospirillum alkalitolerans TaxID=3123374 RepID=A0ABW8PW88_9GAMM